MLINNSRFEKRSQILTNLLENISNYEKDYIKLIINFRLNYIFYN